MSAALTLEPIDPLGSSTNAEFAEKLDIQSLYSVKGKNVLVTGGGRGIGYMIAAGFVRNGCNVAIISRDVAKLTEASNSLNELAKISSSGGKCFAIGADLSSLDVIKSIPARLKSECNFHELHVLVNNSGTSWGEPLEKFSEKGWDRVMTLNIKSIFFLTQILLPLLKAAANPNDPARIINIGSVAGIMHQPVPTYSYDISKASLHHLTRKLAQDCSNFQITVNALAPGFVPSKMSSTLKFTSDQLKKIIPLGRVGNTFDMAGCALYLSSKAGSWVSGAIIPVDGAQLSRSKL